VPLLNETKLWHFKPTKKVGDYVVPGDIYGVVRENNLFSEHRIMIPPHDVNVGKIVAIQPTGDYNITETILEIEDKNGKILKFNMVH